MNLTLLHRTGFGGANPSCTVCGDRLRGQRKCKCENPQWHVRGNPCTRETKTQHLQQMEAWHRSWLSGCHRVLRRDGILRAFGGTRTFHRLVKAMRSVGFVEVQIRAWTYSTGFPKSLNIAKAVDKLKGCDRARERQIQAYLRQRREALGLSRAEVDRLVFGGTTRYSWVEGRGGERAEEVYLPTPEEWVRLKEVLHLDDVHDDYVASAVPSRAMRSRADGGKADLVATEEGDWGYQKTGERWDGTRRITAPSSGLAKTWQGYGTALKPAWEPVVVGRKP